MQWFNEKAGRLTQGAIRAMFDRAGSMSGVISMGIGEPDMATPKLVCQAGKEALDRGETHYTPNAGTPPPRSSSPTAAWARCPCCSWCCWRTGTRS